MGRQVPRRGTLSRSSPVGFGEQHLSCCVSGWWAGWAQHMSEPEGTRKVPGSAPILQMGKLGPEPRSPPFPGPLSTAGLQLTVHFDREKAARPFFLPCRPLPGPSGW